MLIGYLNLAPERLSAGLAAPQNALIACGVQRLYIDVNAAAGGGVELDVAIAELSVGDVLVSPTVSTLTGSIAGLLAIHARIEARGASLRLLELAGGLSLDTATSEGRAILSAVAVMNMLPALHCVATPPEIAVRRAPASNGGASESRARGRPVTAGNQAQEVNRLRAEGVRAVEIAACLGIGRASVYRILGQGQPDGGRSGASVPPRIAGRVSRPVRA